MLVVASFIFASYFVSYQRVESFRVGYRVINTARTAQDRFKTSIEATDLWNEKVDYLGTSNAGEDVHSHRHVPLFVLGNIFYPHGATELNVFEMKYRLDS